MTAPHLTEHASQKAIVDAALLMLRQMGLFPDDLVTAPKDRPPVPTFAQYVRWCPLPSPPAPAGRTARTGTCAARK